MKRRGFITVLSVAVASWPVVARTQQLSLPVLGFLHYAAPDTGGVLVAAVRRGLKEGDYAEGRNLLIEYRWAEGHYDRLPALVTDLLRHRVNVIVAGGNVAAQEAKKATSTIPIVFTSGADPVRSGLVASLSRPGANLTGASLVATEIAQKRLEWMRELLPHARAVAMIVNPNFAGADRELADVKAAGRALGLQIYGFEVGSTSDLNAAFATIGKQRTDAFMVGSDGFFVARRSQIASLAIRYKVAGIYPFPEFPEAGGLVSYGASLSDAYRQAGVYAGRILKGAMPADLPVVQPTRFELVVNLKAAEAIGLEVPTSMLAGADNVIE